MRGRSRWIVWAAGAATLLLLLVVVVARLMDEPLRRRVEAGMNAALKGYKVKLGRVHFSPLGFSVDLVDWVIVQEANPDPPVASIPKLHASLQWTELVRGKVVADFRFDRPKLNLDFRHVKKEAEEKKPVKERGWQEAMFAVYPFQINVLRVNDGDVTYAEAGPLPPVHVSGLQFRAGNIRNVRSKPDTYPSEIRLEGTIQDQAKLLVDGHADFLAEPHVGVDADFDLQRMDLPYLEPILHHWNVTIRRGTLAAKGRIEYSPKAAAAVVSEALLDGADVEYVKHRSEQGNATDNAAKATAKVTQQPSALVKADEIKIQRSKVAYRDETADPPYRLFVDDLDLTVKNFTNVRTPDTNAPGTADIRGKFMDSGDARIHATFRPKENGTDFDVAMQIENTELRTMNDLWRAYGKFDVDQGTLSVFSEVSVKNGETSGYVKPIFADLKIGASDESKGVGQKIYEGVVGGVASILKNPPRQDVATQTSLSGRLDNPHASILEAVGGLVQNAFFEAILPGLQRDLGH